jgi:hypothetical protein
VNLLSARVVLRPRPLGDVLDLTVPFCLGNRRVLGWLAVTALGPACALCLWMRFGYRWRWLAVWALALGLGQLLEGLFTVAYGELLFTEPKAVRARAVWGRFVRRLPGYLFTLLLVRLLLVLTILFIPVAPFVAAHLLFVREVALLEGAGVFAAIARAFRFVQRQVTSVLGLLLALLCAPVLLAIAGDQLGEAIVESVLQLGLPFGALWKEGGSGYALIGFFLSVPVTAAARFLKYADVRTRKEGWDLQLRFTTVAAQDREQHERTTAA